jgi:protocatechuate 3,4-dioxygenase beta subunit
MTGFVLTPSGTRGGQENGRAAQGYKIAGAVVNAVTGAALARAKVIVADTRTRMRRIETVTDERGHFEFAGLPAGKYALQGSRSGYITAGYEQHEQFSTAIVTGPEFATEKLVLRLMPMAMITGHVLDEAGEPVRSAQVRLFIEDHGEGMSRVTPTGGATSDDRGYFDIGALRPGRYFVSVSAKPWYAVHPRTWKAAGGPRVSSALDVAYPTTFYGGATDGEGAAPIELKGGEKAEIDIRMSPVTALHLLFRVPVPAAEQTEQEQMNQFRIPILQKRVFDTEEFVQPGQVQPVSPGVYEISGIAAGRYDVSIRSADPNEPQQFIEMNLAHDGQDLDTTRGETLGQLKVTVKMPGEEPLPRQYAVGLRDARQRVVAFQPGDAGGVASFQAVKPGTYGIVFAAPGKAYSVARTSSAAGVAGHEVVVASGATTEVKAELAGGEVRIEGAVEKNGKPVAGIMVALVPDDPEAHVDLLRRDQSDFDGTFLLQGVVPGRYTIVAVEDAWGFAWLKAGVLARYVQHGQQVIVGEKMRGVVRLPEAVEVQVR